MTAQPSFPSFPDARPAKPFLNWAGSKESQDRPLLCEGAPIPSKAVSDVEYRVRPFLYRYVIGATDLTSPKYEIGHMYISYDPSDSRMIVTDVRVNLQFRRMGIGQELYQLAIVQAFRHGSLVFSQGHPRSKPAAGVWRALARSFEVVHGQQGADTVGKSGDYIFLGAELADSIMKDFLDVPHRNRNRHSSSS